MYKKKWYNHFKASERTRTVDLLITNQLLYQLSYRSIIPQKLHIRDET